MDVRPVGTRVLVVPDPPPRRSAVIDTIEYAPALETSGRVVGLGQRRLCERCGAARAPSLHVGDRVLFSHVSGQDVTIGDRRYLMLDEQDVLAVVETSA